MGGKRLQIDLDKLIAATFVFILVISFLGVLLEYQGTSLGEVFQKGGVSIYEAINAINSFSDTDTPLSEDQKAKIGWALTLIIVALVVIYNLFLETTIDKFFGENIDERTKKQISVILTFVFVGLAVISPAFDMVVDFARYVIGGGTVFGAVIFIVGFCAVMFGNLLKRSYGGLITIKDLVKSEKIEKYDIGELMKNVVKEIKGLRDLKRKTEVIIGYIDHIIEELKRLGVKIGGIDGIKKYLDKIVSHIEGILRDDKKIVDNLLRRVITDEKIEKEIENLYDQEISKIKSILDNLCRKRNITGIGDIDNNTLKQAIKKIINDEEVFKALLIKIKELHGDIERNLRELQHKISDIRMKVNNLKAHENMSIEYLIKSLDSIKQDFGYMLSIIGRLENLEVKKNDVLNALEKILNEEERIADKLVSELIPKRRIIRNLLRYEKEEEYNIDELLKKTKSAIENLDNLRVLIDSLIPHLESVIRNIDKGKDPNVKLIYSDSARKELINIISKIYGHIEKEEDAVHKIIKDEIYCKKLEETIHEILNKKESYIRDILKDIKEIDYYDLKEILKNFVKIDGVYKRILENVWKTDDEIRRYLNDLSSKIGELKRKLKAKHNELHSVKNINIQDFRNILNDILTKLKEISNIIKHIERKEVDKDKLIKNLEEVLEKEKEILKNAARRYLTERGPHYT